MQVLSKLLRQSAVALGIVTFTSGSSLAQEFPILEAVRFDDTELEEALVSAPHWLRGLQYVSQRSERLPRLMTFLPDDFGGGLICIQATTINGRYAAIGEYDAPASMAGKAVELEYSTDFPEVWSQSLPKDSGVIVSVGGCDTSPTAPDALLLPSILNGAGSVTRTAQDKVTLVVNIHARAAQEVLATLETSEGAVQLACEKLDTDDAIEFNFTCTTTIGADVTGLTELKHRKISRGREKEGPVASILLPRFE